MKDPMFTESYCFTREVAGRQRQIELDADLLKTLWNAFDGPQTAAGIAEANSEFIDRLIADFIAQGLANLEGDQLIVLTGAWYSSEPDQELSIEDAREMMKRPLSI